MSKGNPLVPSIIGRLQATRIEELESENAKLRELVRFALHRCNSHNPRCDACRDGYDGECELRQRMSELGVDE